jgi:hypothetical protein
MGKSLGNIGLYFMLFVVKPKPFTSVGMPILPFSELLPVRSGGGSFFSTDVDEA